MRKLLGLTALLLALPMAAMAGEAPGYFFKPGGGSGTIASGTANRIPRYTAATTIGNGTLEDDGAGTMGVPGAAAGAAGTSFQFSGSSAGAVTAAHGAAGGDITFSPGQASSGNGTNKNGGLAGTFSISGESGGDATGTGTGGAGSTISFAGGPGGAAAGVGGTSGAGGRINYTAGAPGAANGGTAGAYGWHQFTGYAKIIGQNDAVQLTVKGSATQTANLVEFQTSAGAKGMTFDVTNGVVAFPLTFRLGGSTAAPTDNAGSKVVFYAGAPSGFNLSGDTRLFWWSDGSGVAGSQDTAIYRAAASVVTIGDAATGKGFFQSAAGQIVKTADQTVDSTTAANDTHLVSVSLATTRKIAFELALFFTAGDTLADGWVLSFDQGTATATDFIAEAQVFDGGLATAATNYRTTALATVMSQTATTNTNFEVIVKGHLTVNGAGTFGIKWGKEADAGTALTLRKGSRLMLWDMP